MISIIVPVYNTAKYLVQCLDSILCQTYKNWEAILVDDGSSDLSPKICDEYSLKDTRFSVIHKDNTGVSDSRNIGLLNAKGKYVLFVDSDDYFIETNALEVLFQLAELNNLDMVRGEYKAVDDSSNYICDSKYVSNRMEMANKQIDNPAIFLKNVLCGEYFIFLTLFRREFIANFQFNTTSVFLEDMELYYRLMLKPSRSMYTPLFFYAYRRNPNSVSAQINSKKLENSFALCDLLNELSSLTSNKDLKKHFQLNSLMMYYWTLQTISIDEYYINRSQIIETLSLNELNRRIKSYIKEYGWNRYPIIIYLPPKLGVLFFRCRHCFARSIKKFFGYR